MRRRSGILTGEDCETKKEAGDHFNVQFLGGDEENCRISY
jgi:hypothetical protein